jgi:hypothetical protein
LSAVKIHVVDVVEAVVIEEAAEELFQTMVALTSTPSLEL